MTGPFENSMDSMITSLKTMRTGKLLSLILASGFLVKLAVFIYRGDIDIGGDAGQYNVWAMSIINNFSYVDLSWFPYFKPPGYPFFLSIIYFFSPQNFLLVKFIQIIISTFTAFILFKIGTQIFSEKVGIIAALIFTFHPYAIEQCLHLQTAHPFMLLSSSTIFFLLKYTGTASENKISALVFAGIFLGLGTLTRPNFILLLPIAVFWLYLKDKKIKEILKPCLVLIFSFTVTLSPWVIRNYIKYDEFIWCVPIGGYNFWVSNSAEQHEALTTDDRERFLYLDRGGVFVDKTQHVYAKLEKDFNISELSPKAQERLWYREAFDFIKNNPGDYLELVVYKILNYIRPWLKPWAYPTEYVLVSGVINTPLLIFGLAGLIIALRNPEYRHSTLILLLWFLSGVFTHSFFTVQTRYRFIEVDIFIFIFAAHLLLTLRQKYFSPSVKS